MSQTYTDDPATIARDAYAIAWTSFIAFVPITPDERDSAPRKLREYIDALVSSGERDCEKIAQAALGLIREYEQIAQSRARVTASPSISP